MAGLEHLARDDPVRVAAGIAFQMRSPGSQKITFLR